MVSNTRAPDWAGQSRNRAAARSFHGATGGGTCRHRSCVGAGSSVAGFLGRSSRASDTALARTPATYVIAQPKEGVAKTLLFTAVGFLVVAALLWIVVVVVRGMK